MTATVETPGRLMVNLGCGNRWHPDWVNLDLNPSGPGVAKCDLGRPLPFSESSCDVVYCSAVLEHLRREQALALVRECHRCLKPGGVLRVGVPDLEAICRLYLDKLALARVGAEAAACDYDWIVLELLDQLVRETSGGQMLLYLGRDPLPNEEFVRTRIGREADEVISEARAEQRREVPPARRRKIGPGWMLAQVRHSIEALRRAVLRALLGDEGVHALAVGRFRMSGEVHRWMYDRYSLSELLGAAGFAETVVQTAGSSQIPDWPQYHLDTGEDGSVLKPDLFFMEATKCVPGDVSASPRFDA